MTRAGKDPTREEAAAPAPPEEDEEDAEVGTDEDTLLLLPDEETAWEEADGKDGAWPSTEGDDTLGEGDSGLKKSQIKIVSSWLEETIWKSSNCSLNTLPVCSTKVLKQRLPVGVRGSNAAAKSQTLIFL